MGLEMGLVQQDVANGERLTLQLASWGRLGEAMARHEGRDVFVFGGIPGEKVVAEVLRVRRKYLAARVVELLERSPQRVDPPCRYFGDCTGCQWQHLDYPAQLEAKRERVVDAFQRVGRFADPPVDAAVPSPQQYGYRNHARFTVGPGGALGFVNRETRRFVGVDHCQLMNPEINRNLALLQGRCEETTQLSIRAGAADDGKERADFTDFLVQPRLTGPDAPVPTGQTSYTDRVDGRSFRVSSPSFFQVNAAQAAETARTVRRFLDLGPDDVLLDAYTGVGTFAILLAAYVKKVIAVEESSAAVADARANASDAPNIEFALGKTEDVLGRLTERPDAVVLDPPRTGCRREALDSLVRLAPPRVAYVSCDPETLARDLKVLCQGGYALRRVVPLDMFPQTHHVECAAFLDRSVDSSPVILASGSPRRRELLTTLGMDIQVVASNAPEEPLPGEPAEEIVARLSLAKAQTVAASRSEGWVIGADSMVVLDDKPMGKPADAAQARVMLRELRGTRHQVMTGVTVIDTVSGRRLTDCVTSGVELRKFTDEEIDASVASGTPLDKAGAYAVQDETLRPALSWEGCYANIVGLPVCRVLEMLWELGCKLPASATAASFEACGPVCPNQGMKKS